MYDAHVLRHNVQVLKQEKQFDVIDKARKSGNYEQKVYQRVQMYNIGLVWGFV